MEVMGVRISKYPKQLFIIDGIGALISAILLGVVLVRNQHLFGIPTNALYFLASVPVLFSLYDLYGYYSSFDKVGILLMGIASMNIGYCVLSFGVILYNFELITYWGWPYIIIEIVIVIVLAIVELKASRVIIRKMIE